jgi:hypothetical protein
MATGGENEKPEARGGAAKYFTSKTAEWKQLLK